MIWPKWVPVENQNSKIKNYYKHVIDANKHYIIGYSCIRKDYVQINWPNMVQI
jgi:hypothetical protein